MTAARGTAQAWLAGLLTPLARHAIDGPCPLFLNDANVAGSGKSKLVNILSIVATGRKAARMAFIDKDEEMEKRILALAIAGDPIVLIDNVPNGGSLGWPSLDGVLTGTMVKGRILKESRVVEVSITALWYATGNNLSIRGDMRRRIIPIRLESDEEKPEQRTGFAIQGDLLEYVRNHRGKLVVAALTILRGYILAGRPDSGLTPMDYPAWDRVVRRAVHWATGFDPCGHLSTLDDADEESDTIRDVIHGWGELQGDEAGITAATALDYLDHPANLCRFLALRHAVRSWGRDGQMPSSKSLGRRLTAIRGRVIGGKALQGTKRDGTMTWTVVEVKLPVD